MSVRNDVVESVGSVPLSKDPPNCGTSSFPSKRDVWPVMSAIPAINP